MFPQAALLLSLTVMLSFTESLTPTNSVRGVPPTFKDVAHDCNQHIGYSCTSGNQPFSQNGKASTYGYSRYDYCQNNKNLEECRHYQSNICEGGVNDCSNKLSWRNSASFNSRNGEIFGGNYNQNYNGFGVERKVECEKGEQDCISLGGINQFGQQSSTFKGGNDGDYFAGSFNSNKKGSEFKSEFGCKEDEKHCIERGNLMEQKQNEVDSELSEGKFNNFKKESEFNRGIFGEDYQCKDDEVCLEWSDNKFNGGVERGVYGDYQSAEEKKDCFGGRFNSIKTGSNFNREFDDGIKMARDNRRKDDENDCFEWGDLMGKKQTKVDSKLKFRDSNVNTDYSNNFRREDQENYNSNVHHYQNEYRGYNHQEMLNPWEGKYFNFNEFRGNMEILPKKCFSSNNVVVTCKKDEKYAHYETTLFQECHKNKCFKVTNEFNQDENTLKLMCAKRVQQEGLFNYKDVNCDSNRQTFQSLIQHYESYSRKIIEELGFEHEFSKVSCNKNSILLNFCRGFQEKKYQENHVLSSDNSLLNGQVFDAKKIMTSFSDNGFDMDTLPKRCYDTNNQLVSCGNEESNYRIGTTVYKQCESGSSTIPCVRVVSFGPQAPEMFCYHQQESGDYHETSVECNSDNSSFKKLVQSYSQFGNSFLLNFGCDNDYGKYICQSPFFNCATQYEFSNGGNTATC